MVKKHILITGGAGFVGSHLCDLFLKNGYAVTALDNLMTGRLSNLDQAKNAVDFHFIKRDVCKSLTEIESEWVLLKKYGLHGVLHFACPASPVDFDRIPIEILDVDSIGTKNTIELALKYHARYLLASTSEIYGDPLVHPQKEDYWGNVNPIGPRSCYDETKRFAEAYVSSMRTFKKGQFNAGIIRIFNTYGPRMRADDGRVVPELCSQAIRGEPLSVHGDGSQTRSFCYVSDLVDGIAKIFESNEFGPFNLGSPVERTVYEFAEALAKLAGGKAKISTGEARPDDPKRRCPDISKVKQVTGWEPKVEFEEGLRRTYEYFKQTISP